MKLILTAEVAGLGAPGDIVEVKDGYGRNYLVPRGAGDRAGPRAPRSRSRTIRRAREAREIRDLGHAKEIEGELGKRTVTVKARRAGEAGRLFGSVTAADVVDAVAAAGGPRSTSGAVELPGQIKTVGSHPVTVGCTRRSPPRWRSRSSPS